MTLQEEEKSVIQAGAYIVIKSHVKKKKKANTHVSGSWLYTTYSHWLCRNTSCQSRCFNNEKIMKKAERKQQTWL